MVPSAGPSWLLTTRAGEAHTHWLLCSCCLAHLLSYVSSMARLKASAWMSISSSCPLPMLVYVPVLQMLWASSKSSCPFFPFSAGTKANKAR